MSLDLRTKHYRAASHEHHRDTTPAGARTVAHTAHRVATELELLYENNYLRESYHDHLHWELLLGGTAATIIDIWELLLRSTSTAARWGVQPRQSEYVLP